MRKIFSYTRIIGVLGLLTIFTATSCDDSFLEVVPEGTASLEEFLNTPEDVQEALNSAYTALRSGSFMGGQTWHLSELFADHLDGQRVSANGDWNAHYTRTTDIFLGTTRSFMADGYKAVARANFVLDNIGLVEGMSAEEVARISAECKFIRGLSFFELVRIFGQPYGFTPDNSHLGIPLRLTYGREILPRATVGAVYDQAIADLTEAMNVLPESNNGYATSWAAKGYLAKIYFQMNDFQKAYDLANDVIANGPFTFEADIAKRFSQGGSPENVFELISTDLQRDNSGGWLRDNYRPNPGNNNIPNITLSQYIYNLATADANDLRGTTWYMLVETGSRPLYLSTKFEIDVEMNVPLVHLTELKLIRAESAGELGTNLDIAGKDLSDIRTRAGLSPLGSGLSASTIIETARKERELEMVGEGTRLHDLKRRAVNGESNLLIRGAIWSCPGLVAQIPDGELKGNLDMIPNEEGGCN